MLGQLKQKRRDLRHMIRYRELQQEFTERRGCLSAPPVAEARQLINQTLRSIKQAIQNNDESNLHTPLLQFRIVADNYNVAQCFATQIFFSVDLPQVQMGLLPLECTWVSVFCYLLSKVEDFKLQKELLKIYHSALYQLRLSIGKMKELAIELLMELIQNMPYRLCDCKNYQIWSELCQIFGEALICSDMMGVQQTLMANPSPLMSFLYRLTTDYQFFKLAQARVSFLEVSLLVIAIQSTLRVRYQNIEGFKEFVGDLLVQNFDSQQIQAVRNHEYIKTFVLKGGLLKNNQLYFLESFIHKQDKHGILQASYYQMFNSLLCFHNHILDIQTVGFLLNSILEEKERDEAKKWMARILKQHLMNRENEWTFQQQRVISEIVKENQDKVFNMLLHLNSTTEDMCEIVFDLLRKAQLLPRNRFSQSFGQRVREDGKDKK